MKLYFVALLLFVKTANPEVIENHYNYKDKCLIEYSLDRVKENITLSITCKCKGWVGIGISSNGGMTGADVVIGWIVNGEPFYNDRHAIGKSMPLIDERQDYDLMDHKENATHTMMKYRRKLITCDSQDYAITKDTANLIFAWSDVDPADEHTIPKHEPQNRGRYTILFFNEMQMVAEDNITPDVVFWDITNENFTIPPVETMYWCIVKKLPQFAIDEKHYFIGRDPIIPPHLLEHIHHIDMQICFGDPAKYEARLDKPYDCTNVMEDDLCMSYLAIWTVGAGAYFLPKDVGIPVGQKFGSADYFLAQFHYNNYEKKTGMIDETIFRMYLTNKTREKEAGTLAWMNSMYPATSVILPPKQPKLFATAIIPSECTKQRFPKEGIKVFNGLLHAHLTGRKMVVKHVRNGTELPPIVRDNNYDFDFQRSQQIYPEITILPGDEIIFICEYNTMDVDKPVLSGLGTSQEMCFASLQYYPLVDFSYVYYGLEQSQVEPFFGNPGEVKLEEVVRSFDYSKFDIKGFEELELHGNVTSICYDNNSEIFLKVTKAPKIERPYEEKRLCRTLCKN